MFVQKTQVPRVLLFEEQPAVGEAGVEQAAGQSYRTLRMSVCVNELESRLTLAVVHSDQCRAFMVIVGKVIDRRDGDVSPRIQIAMLPLRGDKQGPPVAEVVHLHDVILRILGGGGDVVSPAVDEQDGALRLFLRQSYIGKEVPDACKTSRVYGM